MKPTTSMTFCLSAAATALLITGTALAGNFDDYSSVYIAPVTISSDLSDRPIHARSSSSDDERPVSESDLSRKSEDLYEDIVDALDDHFEIADSAGAGILTIQPMMTELKASKPTSADYRGNPSLSHHSQYAGGADVTFTLLSGGAELGSYERSYYDDIDPYFEKIRTWEDADRAFRIISRSLAKHLKN